MTHAERIREQERAVLEAAKALHHTRADLAPESTPLWSALWASTDTLLALEAETCPECGGVGASKVFVEEDPGSDTFGYQRIPCPAGAACDNGRRVKETA
jgi:hypothetical protein